MADKVIGGTPKAVSSLCFTCRAAQIVKGLNLQNLVFCQALPKSPQIGFPVVECSVYDDKRQPALYQMQQIAWEVHSRNRGPAGFGKQGEHEITITPPEPGNNQPTAMPTISGHEKGQP